MNCLKSYFNYNSGETLALPLLHYFQLPRLKQERKSIVICYVTTQTATQLQPTTIHALEMLTVPTYSVALYFLLNSPTATPIFLYKKFRLLSSATGMNGPFVPPLNVKLKPVLSLLIV